MQFKKYLVMIASIISVNAYASDSGQGYKIESTQVLHDVPMPEWMKQGGNKNAMVQNISGNIHAEA